MSIPIVSAKDFSMLKYVHLHKPLSLENPISRKHYCSVIRCSSKRVGESGGTKKNYYELLGVKVDSDAKQIKEAYRKLQKKYHPDIAGQEGHEYTLLLNEAYNVLMKDDLRTKYDHFSSHKRVQFGKSYSSWRGPLQSRALFVDENACIGCRECVHNAGNTFVMDETLGCARVKVQYGDDEENIKVSVDSCPVNCIHWVDAEELPVLEFLIQPQPKKGHGIYGQGWERPKNVFKAANDFKKKLDQEAKNSQSDAEGWTIVEETPAQAKARADASMQLKMERFSRLLNWTKKIFDRNQRKNE